MRTQEEIKKRSVYIRRKTPDVLAQCFELQNHICDLCGYEIQSVSPEVAELDHSVSVYYFASSDLEIEDAEVQCNGRNNLRAVHGRCNTVKKTFNRDEWFAKGMDELVGPAKILTPEEIEFLRSRASEIGRKAGLISNQNPENRNRLNNYRTFENCSKGGKLGGQKCVETGHIIELGLEQGKKNKESGHWDRIRILGLEGSVERGRVQGLKNVESGHLQRLDQGKKNAAKPGYMSMIGKIGGKKRGLSMCHLRWHVRRNIFNPNCELCKAERGL